MSTDETERFEVDRLPPLYQDRSFWGMTITQFLGAFNDNLFKQLMLLLALKVAVADRQPVAMLVFSAPFLLFSGFAGYLSDRYSKRWIVVLSKVAEIGAMALGLLGFFFYDHVGFTGLLVVLFLMGAQSAFFGPGKYGILPEMLRKSDLPRANGLILMTTFLAIIFGTAAAGLLSEMASEPPDVRSPVVIADVPEANARHESDQRSGGTGPELSSTGREWGGTGYASVPRLEDRPHQATSPRDKFSCGKNSSARAVGVEVATAPADSSGGFTAQRLWIGSLVCVAIAVIGTLTSLLVRAVPASSPHLRFTPSALTVPGDTLRMLRADRPLVGALFASCVFWLVAGITQPTVNSLGKRQLELTDGQTSTLAASVAIGIAVGAVVAGRLSRGRSDFGVMRFGGWGLIVMLLVLSLPGRLHGHLLGFWGSMLALIGLGMCAGMYAIPLQVFMQTRPPDGKKGRMIAVMNQANWVAILLSAVVYWSFDQIVIACGWNRNPIFAMTALVMLPALLLYHPNNESPDVPIEK